MPFPEGVSLAKLAGSIRFLASLNPKNLVEKTKISQAVQSLKQIIFLDSGVIDILRKIEQGSDVERDILIEYSEIFSSLSNEMAEILSYIDPYEFSGNDRISVTDMQSLASVKFRKINFRRDISVFFKDCSEAENLKEDEQLQVKAAGIVMQVEKLNRDIDKLTKKLTVVKISRA